MQTTQTVPIDKIYAELGTPSGKEIIGLAYAYYFLNNFYTKVTCDPVSIIEEDFFLDDNKLPLAKPHCVKIHYRAYYKHIFTDTAWFEKALVFSGQQTKLPVTVTYRA